MKLVYITEDGFSFDNEKAALKWENELGPIHQRLTEILLDNRDLSPDEIAHLILREDKFIINLMPF